MPATYAHHRFGQDCLRTLPKDLQDVCGKHKDCFELGLHGPDFLFYYQPFKSNKVSRYGFGLHEVSGKKFFSDCRANSLNETLFEHPMTTAYLLGFLAHYALDSRSHSYIRKMVEETGLSHNLIEAQYEAFLMKLDGFAPLKVDRSSELHPSIELAETVARFFPFERDTILTAMKWQKLCLRMLYSPLGLKKVFFRFVFRSLKIEGHFDDLFLDRETMPVCESINRQILDLQNQALVLYPVLVEQILCFAKKAVPLGPEFEYDFDGELHRNQHHT